MNQSRIGMITVFLFVSLVETAWASRITLGPIVQRITPQSTVLMWQTDVLSDSQIEFGTSIDQLTQRVVDRNLTKYHEMEITGLNSFSTYYYTLGSTHERLMQPANSFRFTTAPTTATEDKTIRVWVLGDPGTGTSEQEEVKKSFLSYEPQEPTDVILTVGDNAYSDGTEQQFRNNFFKPYQDIFKNTPVWPSKGNHDRDADAYSKLFSLPSKGEVGGAPSGTELYYSFNYGPVHFVSINSDRESISTNDEMLEWLKQDLKANRQQWTIAYFHHAPYSRGSHDSDTDEKMSSMRKHVLPILEQYGTDLVLGGHSHSYERSYLMKGHYGPSNTLTGSMILDRSNGSGPQGYSKRSEGSNTEGGVVYQLIGTSGHTSVKGRLGHPTSVAESKDAGSVILTITQKRLESVFLTSTGEVKDRFSIH